MSSRCRSVKTLLHYLALDQACAVNAWSMSRPILAISVCICLRPWVLAAVHTWSVSTPLLCPSQACWTFESERGGQAIGEAERVPVELFACIFVQDFGMGVRVSVSPLPLQDGLDLPVQDSCACVSPHHALRF